MSWLVSLGTLTPRPVQNIVDVKLDCTFRNIESSANLLIAVASRQQLQHCQFSLRPILINRGTTSISDRVFSLLSGRMHFYGKELMDSESDRVFQRYTKEVFKQAVTKTYLEAIADSTDIVESK